MAKYLTNNMAIWSHCQDVANGLLIHAPLYSCSIHHETVATFLMTEIDLKNSRVEGKKTSIGVQLEQG